MKKLFKMIRQENLEEVKKIIENKPELVNCTATPPPKKDIGQSPLQVAIKTDAFEIAYYLLEHGANVNFIESEEEVGTGELRMPVLHDAIRTTLHSLCYSNIKASEEGLKLVKRMLELGADPNQKASNGIAAFGHAVLDAEYLLKSPSAYSDVQEFTRNQLIKLLDLLVQYGANKEEWLNSTRPFGETNLKHFVDDFVPEEDSYVEIEYRGKVFRNLVEGNIDRQEHMRKIMQEYFKDKEGVY